MTPAEREALKEVNLTKKIRGNQSIINDLLLPKLFTLYRYLITLKTLSEVAVHIARKFTLRMKRPQIPFQ